MRADSNDRVPPAANQGHSNVISDDNAANLAIAADIHRCTRCRHPIHAPLSVRIGMGPVCRREVAA